jgi:hypothetical protein
MVTDDVVLGEDVAFYHPELVNLYAVRLATILKLELCRNSKRGIVG